MDILVVMCFNPWMWYMLLLICIFLNLFLQYLIVFWVQVFYHLGWTFSLCTFFFAIVNGIVFLFSLSDSSLLVHKYAIYFQILTLYPTALPNSFIRFIVEPIGFSLHNIMSSMNNDSFNSSFPVWRPLTSCLITVASTSSTISNKSCDSRAPCLVPDLKGNAFSFCPLSMMLSGDFSYMAIIILRYAPSISTLLRVFFTINVFWIL